MKEKLLLILNPKSGTMRARDNFFSICSIFCEANFDVSIRITKYPGHAAEIAYNDAMYFDRIVCCGGDGTLHEVVCGLLRLGSDKRPPLGYIPSGTTNDFAKNFGLPSDSSKAAVRIIEGDITNIDVGKFGNDDNYFTYVASTGAFTDTSYRTPQNLKNAIGYMAYVIDAITHLGNIKPIHMRVTAGEKVFCGDYIFASVSNSTTVAKMIKIDKVGVDMSDGLFELILIKSPQNLKDADTIAKSLLIPNDPKCGLVRAQADSIRFELDSESMWTLDGEFAKAPEDFTITNMYRTLKFIK